MEFNTDLIPDLVHEIDDRLIDFNQYFEENIIVIDDGLDWKVNDKLSYREWVESKDLYPTIKLEQFEDCPNINDFLDPDLSKYVEKVNVFVTNAAGTSFDWHTDNLNVYLYVLCGYKRVETPEKEYKLQSNEYALIEKGTKHKVYSDVKTVALSIGFK